MPQLSPTRLSFMRSSETSAVQHRLLNIAVATNETQAGTLRMKIFEDETLSLSVIGDETFEIRDTNLGNNRVTKNNSLCSVTEHLDEHGVVLPGTTITDGTPIISVVCAKSMHLGKRPPKGMEWIVDDSRFAHRDWIGSTVLDVHHESSDGQRHLFPIGVLHRAKVSYRHDYPIEIGDQVDVNGHQITIRRISHDEEMPKDSNGVPADLLISQNVAESLGISSPSSVMVTRTDKPLTQTTRHRVCGPYSLITQIPIGHRCPFAIDEQQIEWLLKHGLTAISNELACLKCDDLDNRGALQSFAEQEVDHIPQLNPTISESFIYTMQMLRLMGVAPEFETREDVMAMRLRVLTAASIRDSSSGEIKRPQTIDFKTYEYSSEGLFCPKVFGSGEFSRRRSYGHFELAAEIVPMIWRMGRQPILASALEIDPELVEQILFRDQGISENSSNGWQFAKWTPSSAEQGYSTGTKALKMMLAKRDKEQLPVVLRENLDFPFVDVLYVTPPDFRPLVLLDSGNWATSDLNDHYRNVINRSNRLRKLIELNVPAAIVDNECRMLQSSIDTLQANLQVEESKQAIGSNGPLKSATDMAIQSILNRRKHTDWCAQGRILLQSRENGTIGVPEQVFNALRLNGTEAILVAHAEHFSGFIACVPEPISGRVFHLSECTAKRLNVGDAEFVAIQRLLSESAKAECEKLRTGDIAETATLHRTWLDATSETELLEGLIDTVTTAKPVSLATTRGVYLSGTGPYKESAEIKLESSLSNATSVPKQDRQRTEPTVEEIQTAIKRHRSQSCFITVASDVTNQISPTSGRIGGRPRMPVGSTWPRYRDELVPFVAQLPLEMACNAGLLPFDVDRDAMLTIFWHDEWYDSPTPSSGAALTIHSTDNLVELEPPIPFEVDSQANPIEIKIESSLPQWPVMQEILKWELENPKQSCLKSFCTEHWVDPDEQQGCSRIGGQPLWIQSADSIPFVAQVSANDATHMNFGDCGTLYVFGESPNELSAYIQCY